MIFFFLDIWKCIYFYFTVNFPRFSLSANIFVFVIWPSRNLRVSDQVTLQPPEDFGPTDIQKCFTLNFQKFNSVSKNFEDKYFALIETVMRTHECFIITSHAKR